MTVNDPWIVVELAGGPAEGYRYETLVEPDDVILMFADPFHDGQWLRVVGPWEGAIPYRQIERDADKRIYVPAEAER